MTYKYYYYEEYIYHDLNEKIYFNYYSTEDNIQHVFDDEDYHNYFEMFGEGAFLLDYKSKPLFNRTEELEGLSFNFGRQYVFHSKLEELTKEEYFSELMLKELKK